jgi:hypothetical protein
MTKTLNIKINSGVETCATKVGEFCEFMGSTHFGTRFVCCLFPTEKESHTVLKEKDGWIQRAKVCLEAEHKND